MGRAFLLKYKVNDNNILVSEHFFHKLFCLSNREALCKGNWLYCNKDKSTSTIDNQEVRELLDCY